MTGAVVWISGKKDRDSCRFPRADEDYKVNYKAVKKIEKASSYLDTFHTCLKLHRLA